MWVLGRTPSVVACQTGESIQVGGGWQDALLEVVANEPNLDLLVAYSGAENAIERTIGGVRFVSVGGHEAGSGVRRVLDRWSGQHPGEGRIARCVQIAREFAPHVIHVHGTESGLGLMALGVDAPVLISLQGILSVISKLEDEQHPGRVSVGAASLARGVSPWHDQRRQRTMASIERTMLSQVAAVAGRTAFDQRITRVLAPQADYLEVGELLRPEFWSGGVWSPSALSSRRVMTVSGRSFARKGLDTAIQSVALLRNCGIDVRLNIIGSSPASPVGRAVMQEAAGVGLDASIVTLAGPLTAVQVREALLSSDVYALPSRIDNSPNSLCEAMILGVPCVASTAGGVPSLARDGLEALLVPPGDPYSLAGALLELFSSTELSVSLGSHARMTAIGRHDQGRVIAQLLAAYEAVSAVGRKAKEG